MRLRKRKLYDLDLVEGGWLISALRDALTWKRAGVHRNSPKVYSLKKLKELKDGIDPLLKSLI